MALLEGGLIDADLLQRLLPPAFQPAVDRSLLDARRLCPAEVQQLGNPRNRGLLEPADDQGLKQGGEPPVGFRPGHRQLLHPMILAGGARTIALTRNEPPLLR